ncbi:hypothetical protein TNCV_684771 [Trichonephila clavipes]|nr:hypothetical protein TNCV_684771 [Trichonephila clavipes]
MKTCFSVSDVEAGVEPRLVTLELPDILTSDSELQQPEPRRSRYESRRKDEKKDQYLKSLTPAGGGWRKRTAERGRNWSDVTRGKGAVARVPSNFSLGKENAFFFCSRNEKEKSLQGETYRRHSRWNEAGTSFNTDPSSDERQMHLKCSN